MAIVAPVRRSYVLKFLVMAVVLFGFGGWCVFDALVRYPEQNRRFAAYYYYESDKPEQYFDEMDNPRGWDPHDRGADYAAYRDYAAYAEAQGWPIQAQPAEPNDEANFFMQWVQLGIAVPFGLLTLFWALRHQGAKLVVDENGLSGPGGSNIPLAAIETLDKSKWDSKGIVYARYKHDGREGEVKIDDFVFDNAEAVLKEVEAQTGLGDTTE